MLLQLPLELVLNISNRLEFKDKLNLKLTCHKLDKLVTTAALYEDLDLLKWELWMTYCNNRKKSGDKIIQKLMDNNFDGSGVKVLHVDVNSLSEPILSQLPSFFPNVTRVICPKEERNRYSSFYQYPRLTRDNPTPLIKWRNTVTKIDSDKDWDKIVNDVFWSKYPKLTHLRLEFYSCKLPELLNSYPVTLFSNVPSLTRLYLHRATLNLDILESIHAGCPLLMSIRLSYPKVELKDDTILPKSIRSANTVLHLEIYKIENIYNHNGLFVDYLVKKYTNLQQLEYCVESASDYKKVTRDEFKKQRRMTYQEFEEMVSAQLARSEERISVGSTSESRLFSNLPKTLQRLKLEINHIGNAVLALATSATNITMLDISHEIMWKDINVFEHFKELKSLRTLTITSNSSVQICTQPFISSSVTRLIFNMWGGTFYMDRILSMFPSVEELCIRLSSWNSGRAPDIKWRDDDNIDDRDTKETESRSVFPKLRILTITRCSVHSSVFDHLNTAIPNLEEISLVLDLPSFSPINTTTPKYDLSKCCLNKCNITFSGGYKSIIFAFITIKNATKQIVFDYDKESILPAGRSYHKSDAKWVELKFGHVKHLKILGFLTMKIGDKIVVDL